MEIENINKLFESFGISLEFDGKNIKTIDKTNGQVLEMRYEFETVNSISLEDVLNDKYNSKILVSTLNGEISFNLELYNDKVVVKTIHYYPKETDIRGVKITMYHGTGIPGVEISYSNKLEKNIVRDINAYDFGKLEVRTLEQSGDNSIIENNDLSNEEYFNILNDLPCLDSVIDYFSIEYPNIRDLFDSIKKEKSMSK